MCVYTYIYMEKGFYFSISFSDIKFFFMELLLPFIPLLLYQNYINKQMIFEISHSETDCIWKVKEYAWSFTEIPT